MTSNYLSNYFRKIRFDFLSTILIFMSLLYLNQLSFAQNVKVINEEMPSLYLTYDSKVKVKLDGKKKSKELVKWIEKSKRLLLSLKRFCSMSLLDEFVRNEFVIQPD